MPFWTNIVLLKPNLKSKFIKKFFAKNRVFLGPPPAKSSQPRFMLTWLVLSSSDQLPPLRWGYLSPLPSDVLPLLRTVGWSAGPPPLQRTYSAHLTHLTHLAYLLTSRQKPHSPHLPRAPAHLTSLLLLLCSPALLTSLWSPGDVEVTYCSRSQLRHRTWIWRDHSVTA
jgi:hypothetical protein